MTSPNTGLLSATLAVALGMLHTACVFAAPPSRTNPASVPRTVPAAQTPAAFTLNARVFITGKAARQHGTIGTAQLKGSERELTTYLTYRDYRLIQKGSATVSLNQAFTLNLPDNASVAVTVVSSNRDLIKIQVVWKLPGQQDLNTKLNVVRNRATMIGGPRHPAGGIYLLSLTVK